MSFKKKFAIICGYFSNESYGLLGPQMAATIIQENTSYNCKVIAVPNKFNKILLIKILKDYPIVGFSTLGGRLDLFTLAKELKDQGIITILAGPQAGVDYLGEADKHTYPHRFQGFSDNFNFAVQGPAEQIIPFLNSNLNSPDNPGFLYKDESGKIIINPAVPYSSKYLSSVNWDNIFYFDNSSLIQLKISSAQVLQQIGCPHASKLNTIFMDYPQSLSEPDSFTAIKLKGCTFCDVAIDKGFLGNINAKAIKEQLKGLPEDNNSRKLPFELINENPVPKLESLFDYAESLKIKLSQINLTLRADYFIKTFNQFTKVLKKAENKKIKILVSSIGFESFDNTILKNLNKGVKAETNIEAAKKLRLLGYQFQNTLLYSRQQGANHGFIHPTPWDTKETDNNNKTLVARYNLGKDILPNHSTPLIIHHASALADWARQIETDQKIKFSRHGTTIGWWKIDGKISI